MTGLLDLCRFGGGTAVKLDSSKKAANGGLKSWQAAKGSVWLTCELLAIRSTPTWVAWDFVESEKGEVVACAMGGCSPTVFQRIISAHAQAGTTLKAGCEVAVHVQHRTSATFGDWLYVVDAEVLSVSGEVATKAEAIREALIQDGTWGRNRAQSRPLDYVSLAVVAPAGSAAIGDFKSVVFDLERLGLTSFHYIEARFQGSTAAAGLAASLSGLEDDCRNGVYDAVVLTRGGGKAADFACLIDYCLIDAICRCPVPVVAGIGHARDTGLIDEAACISCATPTRAAHLIYETVVLAALEAHQVHVETLLQATALLDQLDSGMPRQTMRALLASIIE